MITQKQISALEAAIKARDDAWQAYQGWKGGEDARQRYLTANRLLREGEYHDTLLNEYKRLRDQDDARLRIPADNEIGAARALVARLDKNGGATDLTELDIDLIAKAVGEIRREAARHVLKVLAAKYQKLSLNVTPGGLYPEACAYAGAQEAAYEGVVDDLESIDIETLLKETGE